MKRIGRSLVGALVMTAVICLIMTVINFIAVEPSITKEDVMFYFGAALAFEWAFQMGYQLAARKLIEKYNEKYNNEKDLK